MNILITGCNGQLGNEMQLLESQYPQYQWYNTDVQELDISNQQAIEQFVAAHEIDGIVNCAGYTAVDKAEENEELCAMLNQHAPAYLAAAVENVADGWCISRPTMCLTVLTTPRMWKLTSPVPIASMAARNWQANRR
jgi:dTDP-4-dehydrorhamnose reductase